MSGLARVKKVVKNSRAQGCLREEDVLIGSIPFLFLLFAVAAAGQTTTCDPS